MGVVWTVVGRTVVPLVVGGAVEDVVERVVGTVVDKGVLVLPGVVPVVVVVTSTHAIKPTVTYIWIKED